MISRISRWTLFVLSLLLPTFLGAQTLTSLLEGAMHNNNLLEASRFDTLAKQQERASQKSTYYPTLDIGGYYQRFDDRSSFVPGDLYSAYAKLSLDLYDGGRKGALLKQKTKELQASKYTQKALQKNILLQVMQDFFHIKNLQASLQATHQAQKALGAQLKRVKQFYKAKLATKDDVDKLQAAFDTNEYTIESLKFQIFSIKTSLELETGMAIQELQEGSFVEPSRAEYETLESTQALKAQQESLKQIAESLQSIYYPSLRVEDTYSLHGYGRTDPFHPKGPDKQNKLLLTLNMRLFDNASTLEKQKAVLLQAAALDQKIRYQTKEQELQHKLSVQRIVTSKAKLKSAKSALTSAKHAFDTIEKKYNAGVVDNIAYLDALTVLTKAKALYESARNDTEIAYGIYYFYSGENLLEYVK